MIEVISGLIIAASSFYFGVMVTVNRYSAKMQAFRKELAVVKSALKEGKL